MVHLLGETMALKDIITPATRVKIEVEKSGKKHIRTVDVNNVPYGVFKIQEQIDRKIVELEELYEEEKTVKSDIVILRKNRPDGWRVKYQELKLELEKIRESGRILGDRAFFEERFRAIQLILSHNGIEPDDELMGLETWENHIDFTIPVYLIQVALSRDLGKVLAEMGK